MNDVLDGEVESTLPHKVYGRSHESIAALRRTVSSGLKRAIHTLLLPLGQALFHTDSGRSPQYSAFG